jgi:hypothetical protein
LRSKDLFVKISRRSVFVAAVSAVSMLAAFGAFYLTHDPAPPFKVTPLSKDARKLTIAEVEEILRSDFTEFHTIQEIPRSVKLDYTALTGNKFEMVNPGYARSTDMIIPGLTNKELVFVGLADQSAVLIFRRGGLADTINLAVLSHKGNGGMWGVRIDDYSVHDISGLRDALQKGRFEGWDDLVP